MKRTRQIISILIAWVAVLALVAGTALSQDALPSWNDGPGKKAIVELVQATTTQGNP